MFLSKSGHFYWHVSCIYIILLIYLMQRVLNSQLEKKNESCSIQMLIRCNISIHNNLLFHFSSASKYTRPSWPTSNEWHSDESSGEVGTAEKLFHRREISVSFDTCSTYRSEFRSKSIFNFRPAACTGTGTLQRGSGRIHIRVRARKKNIEKTGVNSFFNFPKKIKMGNNRSVERRATETRSNVPRSFNYPAPSGGAYRSTVERRSWFV